MEVEVVKAYIMVLYKGSPEDSEKNHNRPQDKRSTAQNLNH